MSKVLFTITYEIFPEHREQYFSVIKELKHLISADGLESYEVYEIKNKKNSFKEIYTFIDNEAFEAFDDMDNERVNILMNKLTSMIKEQTTNYQTLHEIL